MSLMTSPPSHLEVAVALSPRLLPLPITFIPPPSSSSSVPALLNPASVSFISAPFLPSCSLSLGAGGGPLFTPSWVYLHTVNLRSLSPLPPLFLPPQQLFPGLSLNRKAATAVGAVLMLLLRGQTGVAKYIAAISFCSAVDSFKTFHLPSV